MKIYRYIYLNSQSVLNIKVAKDYSLDYIRELYYV